MNGRNKDNMKSITVLRDEEKIYWVTQKKVVWCHTGRYERNETISKKSNRKDCGKNENMGHFLFINPSKTDNNRR
jgi:hypothetical protein